MTENDQSQLPSKLREANSRHDRVESRIKTIRISAENLGIYAPKELKDDEHYWYTTMNRYNIVSGILKNSIKDKDQLRVVALNIAASEAVEFLRLEKMKSTDTLTGAWSRGALDNFLENLRQRSALRNGDIYNGNSFTTGIILIDGDDFKKYNDANGHPEGDKLLSNLVKIMKEKTRGIDMVSRYGGEEFAIVAPNLLKNTALTEISQIAETIRQAIQNSNIGLTISAGATILKDSDKDLEAIYKRVDGNLYKAKGNGKNVVFSDNGMVLKNM